MLSLHTTFVAASPGELCPFLRGIQVGDFLGMCLLSHHMGLMVGKGQQDVILLEIILSFLLGSAGTAFLSLILSEMQHD